MSDREILWWFRQGVSIRALAGEVALREKIRKREAAARVERVVYESELRGRGDGEACSETAPVSGNTAWMG